MTKKEMFAHIATVNASDADIVAFCNHEIELLNKKNASASKKATKNQIANEAIKDQILDVLKGSDEAMTATQVAEAMGLSVNKVSALLTQLKEDNAVVRTVGAKRKAFFSIA